MKRIFTIASMALLTVISVSGQTMQSKLTANDRRINRIIAQMSLEEKVEMLHSKTIMSSEEFPDLVSRISNMPMARLE